MIIKKCKGLMEKIKLKGVDRYPLRANVDVLLIPFWCVSKYIIGTILLLLINRGLNYECC